MIIPKLSREEKKKIKKEKYKLEKKMRKYLHNEKYDNDSVTQFGNFSKILAFKELIGIDAILAEVVENHKHYTCVYTLAAIVDLLIDACILGVYRFSHLEQFLTDEGFKKLTGMDNFPTERTIRETLYTAQESIVNQLETVNEKILEVKSQTETPRYIWVDVDSTTITLFGSQEGSEKGYNAKYKGRPCLQVKLAFVAGTNEILRMEVHNGKSASNTDHLEFLASLEQGLPKNWIVEGIRTDRGYFSEDNLEYYEYAERGWKYVCKAKKNATVKKIIEYIDAQKMWKDEDAIYSFTEITVPLKSWEHARRFVIIRENISERKLRECGQFYAEGTEQYEYSVIVTNLEDPAPMDVWRFYNKRANCENKIDELKSGFAVSENSQHELKCNRAYCLIKTIAYNIINWFRQSILPEEVRAYEVKTIRRRIINICANVKGNGRFMTVNFPPIKWLERINGIITDNLKKFVRVITEATLTRFCLQ